MLTKLPIGQRDALLLRSRELTFGTQLQGVVDCPACQEQLELEFDTRSLQISDRALPDLETMETQTPNLSLTERNYQITFRLPTSADLVPYTSAQDVMEARQKIVEACLLSIQQNSQMISVHELPSELLLTLIERMDEADPYANLKLSADCPACHHSWWIVFDIVSYFWKEISSWAARLMSEVHVLAAAYGWQEKEILAMSAWRRQRYLELIGS
jgi:hypothetical protein